MLYLDSRIPTCNLNLHLSFFFLSLVKSVCTQPGGPCRLARASGFCCMMQLGMFLSHTHMGCWYFSGLLRIAPAKITAIYTNCFFKMSN